MPGRADALREMAAITAVLGQLPGQRPPAFWVRVAEIVCERHGVTSLRGDVEAIALGPQITPRHRDVLALAADGLETQQAAIRLGVSPLTVKSTLAHARKRLGAHSTTHAVALALRAGLID